MSEGWWGDPVQPEEQQKSNPHVCQQYYLTCDDVSNSRSFSSYSPPPDDGGSTPGCPGTGARRDFKKSGCRRSRHAERVGHELGRRIEHSPGCLLELVPGWGQLLQSYQQLSDQVDVQAWQVRL